VKDRATLRGAQGSSILQLAVTVEASGANASGRDIVRHTGVSPSSRDEHFLRSTRPAAVIYQLGL